jgi:DNA-directed RNA polymerase specialized sigma24 family protein
MSAILDEEYATVVERERPLMQATAYLLTGDPVQAERVVQLVFAQFYGRWPSVFDSRLEVLRAVVYAARTPVHLPWEYRERVELVDGPMLPLTAVEPIVADLQMLTYDQRVGIVLDRYAGLSSEQIAELLQRPAGELLSRIQRARIVLAAKHPARGRDEALTQELRDAIPYELRESRGSANDLVHGRQLAHRRWIRAGLAVLVGVALMVAAAVMFIPQRPTVSQVAPPLPVPEASTLRCGRGYDRLDGRDPSSELCRAKILRDWRSRMAQVAASHLDPKGTYFTGFGYFYDGRYDTPGFWSGQGGALAFQMSRVHKGATEIYLQISTNQKFAVRCGATTRQKCLQMRFMDGNTYLLTDSTLAEDGLEIQYCPRGHEVITVIARNTRRGKVLKINNGDLIKLVQDPRLRLPKR